jgi:3',5'-cyclic-AMP phosphodiesterase
MKRRQFIGTTLTAGAGITAISAQAGIPENREKSFRIVHVTDMHIFPSEKVEKAMSKLLGEIHSLDEKPDFVLNTGDNIMDALERSKEDVHEQWQAWLNYFKNKLEYPMYACIGNHDVWGWGIDDKNIEKDLLYGKSWAQAMLGLDNRYYTFENKGWKFICLDSPLYAGSEKAYTAKLDNEQFNWLKNELKNTHSEKPVCIASHIPILSAAVFFDGDHVKNGEWEIPGAWMHTDAKELKSLFYEFPNVKVALSGHVHLADKTEYLGVNYFCNGAACGGWWKGNYQEFGPAYAIVDFYKDGTATSELIPYEI